ncbi:MAG TPA: hypothetical protein VF556_15535 [Pyrinomonadaceae bacterium]|jgi:hypothetical protein
MNTSGIIVSSILASIVLFLGFLVIKKLRQLNEKTRACPHCRETIETKNVTCNFCSRKVVFEYGV